MMADSLFTTAETIITIRGALAAGTFGATEFITGGIGVISSGALFFQGFLTLTQRDKARAQIDTMLLVGRIQQVNVVSNSWRLR